MQTYRVVMTVGAYFLAPALPQAWSQSMTPNIVIRWNQAALQGVRDSKLGPPMVSRALAIAHTCMYDAWAAYDGRALVLSPAAHCGEPRANALPPTRTRRSALPPIVLWPIFSRLKTRPCFVR